MKITMTGSLNFNELTNDKLSNKTEIENQAEKYKWIKIEWWDEAKRKTALSSKILEASDINKHNADKLAEAILKAQKWTS